jgi:adenylate cyclase
MGDGALVEFASVVDAVACAVEIQAGVAERTAGEPADRQIAFRIGINLGDVIIDGEDIYGDGVNIAARLEGVSEPGGIVVSGAAYDQAKNKLDVAFEPLGERSLKNIAEKVRVYRIRMGAGEHSAVGPRVRRWMPLAAAVIAVIVVVGATVAFWPQLAAVVSNGTAPSRALPDKPSIAVLPFDNLGGGEDQDYLVEGLTDDLTTDLSKISGLFVISRNSAFAYRGRSADIEDVAGELGVRYVLVGSVRRAGESIRISAQLVDSTNGSEVWAERYDRAGTDIFAVEDEVIGRIVEALAVHLTPTERTRLARLPTANLEAYDYYLRAEQMAYIEVNRSLVATLDLYEKAIELDPAFADAYAGYARTLVDVLGFDHQEVMLSAVARQQAYDAAGKALAINPDTPRAYAVLGILQMLDGRHDQAIASVQKAVALDPNGADAYLNLAVVLTYAGRHEEALAAMDKVLELNPLPEPQVYDYLGLVLFMNRRFEEALAALLKVDGESRSEFGRELLASTYARLGRADDAATAMAEILRRAPGASLEYNRAVYAHFKRPEDLAFRVDALREAGMPQWPFGFTGNPADRLDGTALRALVRRTWTGHQSGGTLFFLQVSANGDAVQRLGDNILIGKASVEDDLFCMQAPAVLIGRKYCSPIYRNPGGNARMQDEYVYPNVVNLWYFSPAP